MGQHVEGPDQVGYVGTALMCMHSMGEGVQGGGGWKKGEGAERELYLSIYIM